MITIMIDEGSFSDEDPQVFEQIACIQHEHEEEPMFIRAYASGIERPASDDVRDVLMVSLVERLANYLVADIGGSDEEAGL